MNCKTNLAIVILCLVLAVNISALAIIPTPNYNESGVTNAEITKTTDRLKAILATVSDIDKPAVEQLSPAQIDEANQLWDRLNLLENSRQ